MSYVKTAWVNGAQPYINAENLNKIESGIESSDKFIGTGTEVGKALFTAKDAATARATIGAMSTSGNAATSTRWANARKITYKGAAVGSASIDGSADVTVDLTLNTLADTKVNVGAIADYGIDEDDLHTVLYALAKRTTTLEVKGAAVANLSTTATLEETIKQFNALLVSLRDAGKLTK